MVKCTFCGSELAAGTGKMFVKKDGKILFFDTRKCEKNMLDLGRKAREIAWTEEGHNVRKAAIIAAQKAEQK